MHLMLGQKSALVYAAMAALSALIVGSTCGTADAQEANDVSAYVPLPDSVRDELIQLGVKDPFIIYAVDFNGDLVALVPSDVTVEPVTFPLKEQVPLENMSGVSIIRVDASESTMTCRWPPTGGDPPCSKQTKN